MQIIFLVMKLISLSFVRILPIIALVCCRSVFYSVSDVSILRFMVEVCWGPMLAAFSMTLDQSDDKLATTECLQGFRYAVHVTSVLSMQTQRDAFVTSLAKFTYLHCAADMKQKNVDAMKVNLHWRL